MSSDSPRTGTNYTSVSNDASLTLLQQELGAVNGTPGTDEIGRVYSDSGIYPAGGGRARSKDETVAMGGSQVFCESFEQHAPSARGADVWFGLSVQHVARSPETANPRGREPSWLWSSQIQPIQHPQQPSSQEQPAGPHRHFPLQQSTALSLTLRSPKFVWCKYGVFGMFQFSDGRGKLRSLLNPLPQL